MENTTIPFNDPTNGDNNTKQLPIQIIRPGGVNENQVLPVVMYFHGGGWVLGGLTLMKDW